MKKLMIVAAAAAMTFAGEAALKAVPQICPDCGGGSNSDCPAVVFKVTGSGKAVISKGDYKTVGSLKIKKGALALVDQDYCAERGCCYDYGAFFAKIKAGKKTFEIATTVVPGVWSVFGKSLETIRSKEFKKGKKYTLESALYISNDGAVIEVDGDTELEENSLSFAASAFGKMSVKISQYKNGYCGGDECLPEYTPKSYSGWFVGLYNCVGEEDCFLCDCTDTDVFGGTWKASFKASAKSLKAAKSLAGVKVGNDVIAEADPDADIDDDDDDE